MTATLDQYLDLITSEHRDKLKLVATITALSTWSADLQNLLATIPTLYDIDLAVGDQLDTLGLWIGASRDLTVPISNPYFSLDDSSLGLDLGSMQGPNDPTSGIVVLPDDAYRTLLRAKIAANNWDGSIPQAYEVWDVVFEGTGFGILIQDLENMHMIYAMTGPVPDVLTLALFNSGALSLRPAGVKIDAYITPPIGDVPYFGLDVASSVLAGLDVGYFGIEVQGN